MAKHIITYHHVRKIAMAALLPALVASCTFFKAPGKDDCDKILAQNQMVDILTDIYIYEAFILEYQHIEPSFRDSSKYHYGGILSYHGVDPADFENALDCYLLDRHEMDVIHEKMLNRLSVIESEAQQVEDDALEQYVPETPPLDTVPDSL